MYQVYSNVVCVFSPIFTFSLFLAASISEQEDMHQQNRIYLHQYQQPSLSSVQAKTGLPGPVTLLALAKGGSVPTLIPRPAS